MHPRRQLRSSTVQRLLVINRAMRSTSAICAICTCAHRASSADTALRLGKWFGTSAVFWINLQKSYELRLAQKEIGKELNKIPTRERDLVGGQKLGVR